MFNDNVEDALNVHDLRIMAQKLNFEEAAKLRDEIGTLRKQLIAIETGEF